LGDAHPFEDYASAEREVGWQILRSGDSEWEHVGGNGGIIETFPEIGLPQVRVTYAIKAKGLGVVRLSKAPRPYTPHGDGSLTDATIGVWSGQWYRSRSQVGFIFPTSETVDGRAVIASAFADLDRYSEDEFRAFIASLSFGSELH
jgi:hypothetical protein